MNHQLKINISLDENKVPEKITWEQAQELKEVKAFFLQTWDKEQKVTTSLNLWTKAMTTDEMKMLFHQSLVSMVESLERAVPDESEIIKDLYATCNYFAEKMKLISEEEVEKLIQKAKAEKQLGNNDLDLKSLLP
jgi:gliding motility-associated protein GldC